MQPIQPGLLTTLNAPTATNSDGTTGVLSHTPYSARLLVHAADTASLLLQQPFGSQHIKLLATPPLPANVPLQLTFSPAATAAVNVSAMQWQGPPQLLPLQPAQVAWLQNTAHIAQLAQQVAQGAAIRYLAGEAFNASLPAKPMQLSLVSVNAAIHTVQPTLTELVRQLTQSAFYQKLSPTLQSLLLQPAQQASVLQQLQTKTPILQLGAAALPLTASQSTMLQSVVMPMLQQYAKTLQPEAAGVLLLQPLKTLPAITLTRDMLVTPLNVQSPTTAPNTIPALDTATRAPQYHLANSQVISGDREVLHDTPPSASPHPVRKATEDSITTGALPSLSTRFKEAFSSLREDMMKALNIEKMLSTMSVTGELMSIKLQPTMFYFGRLQQLAQQPLQFVIQTAQGPLKIPLRSLDALQSIPTEVPLQLRFSQPQPNVVDIELKVITALPHTITLSKTQAELLQDPKQLALLQQRLQRGELISHLANEPIKLPTLDAKIVLLNLVAPDNASSRNPGLQGNWQLSIQPVASEQKVQLSSSAFVNVLPLLATQPSETKSHSALPPPANSAWRQLLPLLALAPATLRNLPEMPPAVQQVLALVRQAQPDAAKVLSVSQVQEQLQAAIQFQPLQAQPNLGTAAGTLAVAIQLLLGHLLRQPASAGKEAPTQRLAQAINQLDQQQSSQLLRALGSHSSNLQLAQLQNADSANLGQQWLIPLALQQQQESRLSQVLIEQRETEKQTASARQKYWQLTMKFDLGHSGQLMAVAKLREEALDLQFYTDTPLVLRQAEKFLPLLTDRCQAQGLQVRQATCQLGKIPDTLGYRRTSLISTKA